MRNLNLTLTRQWFDMVEQEIKLEEYRELKPYWIKRLVDDADYPTTEKYDFIDGYGQEYVITKYYNYDTITFTNGYGAHRPQIVVECKGISIGQGMLSWGAPADTNVFVIHLGAVLSRKNEKK